MGFQEEGLGEWDLEGFPTLVRLAQSSHAPVSTGVLRLEVHMETWGNKVGVGGDREPGSAWLEPGGSPSLCHLHLAPGLREAEFGEQQSGPDPVGIPIPPSPGQCWAQLRDLVWYERALIDHLFQRSFYRCGN